MPIGMIADIKEGHAGLDVLAVVAIISTAGRGRVLSILWTVVLMIYSGSVIEAYAQSSAEHNLTALLSAAPQTAHVLGANDALCGVPVSEVQVMDLLLVKPGETVPGRWRRYERTRGRQSGHD